MGRALVCGYRGPVTDSAASLMPSPAWARVRILLNLGRIDEAALAASEAAARTMWCNDDYLQVSGPRIHSLADLPAGWCFLDPGADLAVLNDKVVDEYCMSVSLFQFVRIAQTLSAPAFRWYDVDNWALLEQMDTDEQEARRDAQS
jgi:hypothetical protein